MSDTETTPFVPIALAPDHYATPSTGLSTEKGDSWLTVQQKINAGFRHVYEMFGNVVEAIDTNARKDIAELREELAALQIKFDALVTPGTPNDLPPPPPNPEGDGSFKAEGAGSE